MLVESHIDQWMLKKISEGKVSHVECIDLQQRQQYHLMCKEQSLPQVIVNKLIMEEGSSFSTTNNIRKTRHTHEIE